MQLTRLPGFENQFGTGTDFDLVRKCTMVDTRDFWLAVFFNSPQRNQTW
jgi:hypothetical protein